MKFSQIIIYSFRILARERSKFLLPFFSLLLTALIVTLALGLTGSASIYLQTEAKTLIGGDVSVETNFPIDDSVLLVDAPTQPAARSQTLAFSGTINNQESKQAITVSFQVVDQSFPLYGTLQLENSIYDYTLSDNELLLDLAAADKLKVTSGDTVYVGAIPYIVRDIITREPDVLFNTFKIFPKVILSEAGLARSEFTPELLRGEYKYSYRFNEISPELKLFLTTKAKEANLHLRFADSSGGGFSFALEAVSRFIIVAVLITALLAAVNVYASVTYLLQRLRRNLAVLRALGLPLRTLKIIVMLSFMLIIILAGIIGIIAGFETATYARTLAQQFLEISLPPVLLVEHIVLVISIVLATGIAALIPALERLSNTSPLALLTGDEQTTKGKNTLVSIITLTTLALVPLLLLASLLLKSFTSGVITILAIIGSYVLISLLYRSAIEIIYRGRHKLGFSLRSIIAWKRYDGLFGIISFTSLYIALTAIFILALTQTSIQSFLQNDLGATAPSIYLLDIQSNQAPELQDNFPDLTLFPNISGRLISIDDLQVQTAPTNGAEEMDRELRREFNLTYRTSLITGETITAGDNEIGQPGTVSVDEEFAARANIKIGSQITINIQGFPVSAQVISLRATESRSGLPFFYFVFSPEDLAKFPASYFGYDYLDEIEQVKLIDFIANTMPNVSTIDTAEIGELVKNTITTLLLIIFYIALPPFILACALIIVLVILQYGTRRRDGARLLAIGAIPSWIERQYLLETISTTFLASIGAYLTAVVATSYVATQYLKLGTYSFYSPLIIYGLLGIIGGIWLISLLLWRTDKRPLHELLTYEDNY